MAMTRRQRLMATLQGKPVDRPAVNFYEIGGWTPDPDDPDPYNIYNGLGWSELLELAEAETDIIRMVNPHRIPVANNSLRLLSIPKTPADLPGRLSLSPVSSSHR